MTTVLVIIGIVLLIVFLASGGTTGRGIRRGRSGTGLRAKLEPVRQDGPTWMVSGRAYHERHEDGRESFILKCSGFRTGVGEPRLSAGDSIEVVLDDRVIGVAPLRNKWVQLQLRSDRGDEVPAPAPGSVLALRYDDHVLVRGTFETRGQAAVTSGDDVA